MAAGGQFEHRLRRLEAQVRALPAFPPSDDELISRLEQGTATPLHIAYLYGLVEQDLRTHLYLAAMAIRERKEQESWRSTLPENRRGDPVQAAVLVLSCCVDTDLPYVLVGPLFSDQPYDPKRWRPTARGTDRDYKRWCLFRDWARSELMLHLLGWDDVEGHCCIG